MTGYVRQLHRTVWKKNPMSGHEWPEYTPIQKFEIGGIGNGYGNGPFFRTHAACQKAVDEHNEASARARRAES